MGQISIMPIIRLVLVGIVLLSERILSENAVVGSWAQPVRPFLAENSKRYPTLPYGTLKKLPNAREPHHKRKSCAGETTKKEDPSWCQQEAPRLKRIPAALRETASPRLRPAPALWARTFEDRCSFCIPL